jgi:large subunit ribosomal protein L6
MRKSYEIKVEMSSGINVDVDGDSLTFTKGNSTISRKISIPFVKVSTSGNEILFSCQKTNKKKIAEIKAQVAHLKNIFLGLQERFIYELEVCNVHFPMTVKVDGSKLVITNFLGEKVPRSAQILEGVEIKIEGSKIKVISADIEKAGQTAANIEKASKVTEKDRRIFQDGIFITKKPEAIK